MNNIWPRGAHTRVHWRRGTHSGPNNWRGTHLWSGLGWNGPVHQRLAVEYRVCCNCSYWLRGRLGCSVLGQLTTDLLLHKHTHTREHNGQCTVEKTKNACAQLTMEMSSSGCINLLLAPTGGTLATTLGGRSGRVATGGGADEGPGWPW